ncbi:cohesin domain-containing protein [Pseudoalteromonas rubra]|uniref:cohesin domain-containing protein n=1 Tax=Pseudoalteromonas rubra TaxID=43658 RepID=UPI000F7B2D54|nr:cohesin domain-containing protein [Pseudoalteromonas rubra]
MIKSLILTTSFLLGFAAHATEGRVFLETSSTQIKTASEFYVDVMVKDLPEVYGVQLSVTYDPETLTLIDQDPKTTGAQLEHGNFLDKKRLYTLRNQATTEAKAVQYIVSQVAPAESASGDGRLARLYFSAPTNATNTDISIKRVEFGTRHGEKHIYQTNTPLNLSFDAQFSQQEKPTPEMPDWLAVLSALLPVSIIAMLFWRKMKSRGRSEQSA